MTARLSAPEPHGAPRVDPCTLQAGTALYGALRPVKRAPSPDAWMCPGGHGPRETCGYCLELARATGLGRAFVADVITAEVQTAFNAGRLVRFMKLGRLAAEALAAGMDVGLTGDQVWYSLDQSVAIWRGIRLGAYAYANRWQMLDGLPPSGNIVTAGFVIQRGQ